MDITGHEQDVLAANAAFYAVFSAGDVQAMDGLWTREHDAFCIHPGWVALEGRAAIMDSWRRILDSPQAPSIRCANANATVAGDMGFVVCSELLPEGELVATNVFVRERGTWKICHHHAGPIAQHIAVERPPPDEMN